jgi:hypothetical protein
MRKRERLFCLIDIYTLSQSEDDLPAGTEYVDEPRNRLQNGNFSALSVTTSGLVPAESHPLVMTVRQE